MKKIKIFESKDLNANIDPQYYVERDKIDNDWRDKMKSIYNGRDYDKLSDEEKKQLDDLSDEGGRLHRENDKKYGYKDDRYAHLRH